MPLAGDAARRRRREDQLRHERERVEQHATEALTQQPAENDLEFRARVAAAAASPGDTRFGRAVQRQAQALANDPSFQTQRLEDQALLKSQEEVTTRRRRRLGASGFGATIFTSPLGVTTPAPTRVPSLLGSA